MLLKHSAIYSTSLLINGLIGFLAVAVNTRILGVEAYGYYALAFSTAMFASTTLFEWMRVSLMRFSETEEGPRLLSSSLSLYIGGGAMLLAVSAALFVTDYDGHFPAVGWISVGLFAVCVGFADLFMGLARASLRPSLFAIMQLTRGILTLTLGSAAAWAGYGFTGLLLGMALANVLAMLLGFVRYPVWQSLRPSAPDKESFATLANFGLPIILTTLAAQVLLVVDRYILSAFHGAGAVGAYAAAGDVTQKLIIMLATGINLAAYNITLSVFKTDGLPAAERQLGTTLTLVLAIIMPVVVGMLLIAEPFGHLMFGAAVAQSAAALIPLLSMVALLQVIRICFIEQPYHILKITRGMLWPFVIAGGTALGAWFILVPTLGAMGTVYGLILAHAVGGYLCIRGIKGKFSYIIEWRNILVVGIATLIMAGVVGLLPWPDDMIGLLIRVVAGGAAYAAVLLADDFLEIRSMIVKKLKKENSA